MLRQLPLDERAVLVLRHREGLSVDQVVDVLRVPADVVREREQRALRAVRTAGLLQAEPDALGPLLTAVTGAVPVPAPPDVHALLADAQGRRLVAIGVVAVVVALLAAARLLL